MTLFDLLFILVLLGSIILLAVTVILALSGRRRKAIRLLRFLGIALAVYLLIVAVVAVAMPQKILSRDQSRCFDEMCFQVADVKNVTSIGSETRRTIAQAGHSFCIVTVRITCRGHGHAQSEGGVIGSLVDARGATYHVSEAGQRAYDGAHGTTPPLTARVAPGETVLSVQVFDIPSQAPGLGLHIGHSGPGLFIIGDDESPLHKPTLIRFE